MSYFIVSYIQEICNEVDFKSFKLFWNPTNHFCSCLAACDKLTTEAITSWSASHFLLANCEYFDSLKGGDFLQISCWNATLPPLLLNTRDCGYISIKAALELWAHIRNNKMKPFFLLFYNYITKMAGNLRPFMLLIFHCLRWKFLHPFSQCHLLVVEEYNFLRNFFWQRKKSVPFQTVGKVCLWYVQFCAVKELLKMFSYQ